MRPSAVGLALIALLWHIVFVLSIVDIYFQSPVVQGMSPQRPNMTRPPADRLFLFVADGLRADRFFEHDPVSGSHRAPFLRSCMFSRGSFGLSHCRVPTESRPGHLALLAGIYEDVSAVTTGWRSNPVEADTLLKQAWPRGWAAGSPDIVLLFKEYLAPESWWYDAEQEDFSQQGEASSLDTWTFRMWNERILPAARQKKQEVPQVHFFHLLAIDTLGHASRPSSPSYVQQISRVDDAIRKVVESVTQEFPDGRSVFLFTSDHGMSDKGSHGAGDPSETETPYVVWGSGIRGPQPAQAEDMKTSPRSWEIDDLHRHDVEQADLCPLMAGLLGLPIPINNVGVLPWSLLDDMSSACALMEANARQMLEQLYVKDRLRRQSSSSLFFRSSPSLEHAELLLKQAVPMQDSLEKVRLLEECTRVAVSGLRYYDTYDRSYLYLILSTAMLGWMLYLCAWLFIGANFSQIRGGYRVVQVLVLGVWYVALWREHSPTLYFVYVFFCVAFTSESIYQWFMHGQVVVKSLFHTVGQIIFAWIVLECMVVGFFHRWMFAVLLLLVAFVATVSWNDVWFGLSLLCCAMFPLLPTTFSSQDVLVLFGFAFSALLAFASGHVPSQSILVLCILSGLNVVLHNKMLAWSVLFISCALIVFLRSSWSSRNNALVSIYLIVCSLYAQLSVSYETWFMASLGPALWFWVQSKDRHDLRSALLYLLFTYASFFGTGNSGSLSSFEISSTYRFVTIFSPHLMGALLFLKIALPFIVVGASFGCINLDKHVPQEKAFFSVLLLSSILAINFFFLVRDDGSWRDIGVSISHFGMSNAHILFQLVMFRLPKALGL